VGRDDDCNGSETGRRGRGRGRRRVEAGERRRDRRGGNDWSMRSEVEKTLLA